MKTQNRIVRQLLTEINILRQAIKLLHKRKHLYCRKGKQLPGLCTIINEVIVINWFYSSPEYRIENEFAIYRGSDNVKIARALQASSFYRRNANPTITFMWNTDDIFGWNYRVMFCEGLIEEKLKEVRSRIKSCSSWLQFTVALFYKIN